MTAQIYRIKRVPKLMACCNCDGEEFSIHEDGTIRCWECSGQINAKWEPITSNSQPTGGVPSDAA